MSQSLSFFKRGSNSQVLVPWLNLYLARMKLDRAASPRWAGEGGRERDAILFVIHTRHGISAVLSAEQLRIFVRDFDRHTLE